MATSAAPSAAPPTAPASPFRKRVVVVAARWRAAIGQTDSFGISASTAVERFYAAIEAPSKLDTPDEGDAGEVAEALDALQRSAQLFTLAADPTVGLLAELFRVKEGGVPLSILKALGDDTEQRMRSVDKALARMLVRAEKMPDEAMAQLARVPKQLRALLALRFFCISGFNFCLAAENVQSGLETILGDEVLEACNGQPANRDDSVAEFYIAMDLLRETMPDSEVLQRALDAALGHHRMPAGCMQALEQMTDDGVCPDLSWLHELEAPEKEDDGEDEEDE